jgi:hypothetical protein
MRKKQTEKEVMMRKEETAGGEKSNKNFFRFTVEATHLSNNRFLRRMKRGREER